MADQMFLSFNDKDVDEWSENTKTPNEEDENWFSAHKVILVK